MGQTDLVQAPYHQPVMLEESLDGLQIKPDGTYVDLTFGRGGHSRGLLARLGPSGRLVAFDRDPDAVAAGQVIQDPRFTLCHAPFSSLEPVLDTLGLSQVDGLLADLGVSSPQLDEAGRGFSFMRDGPLDMRMDPTTGPTAAQWLAVVDLDDLEEVLKEDGDERYSGPIARAIVSRREAAARGQAEPLLRTGELAQLVAQVYAKKGARTQPGHHPATRTFQAIRIHLNRELDELETLLASAPSVLRAGGRLAIISFHSLEDRRVKRASRPVQPQRTADMTRARYALLRDSQAPQASALCEVSRCRASAQECAANPRARSAVLRIMERAAA